MINNALNRHSMSQSLDVTSVVPLLSSQISEDKEELLTKEMMLEWKTPNVGFERLLATKAGRKLFDNFLRKEFSSENLQFWIACEKLKSITEEKKFSDHVDVIFKIYIDPSALDEVLNISQTRISAALCMFHNNSYINSLDQSGGSSEVKFTK